MREKKERDKKDDFNGSQEKQPRPIQTKGIMKTYDDTIPVGILKDQLKIISRGLGERGDYK